MVLELYPHNQRAYHSIIEGWKKDNKVAVVQATGTGKSYLILSTLRNFLYEKKLVLAPSNYILEHIQSTANGNDFNTDYMTYSKLMFSDIINKYSLIILDEFHRCGADKWGKEVTKLLENNPNAKILGTSATPIRFLDNERNMSDELFNSNVVSNLSLTDALAQRILPIPTYVSSIFSIEEQFDKLERKAKRSHSDEKEAITSEIKKLRRRFEKSKGGSEIISKYTKGEETKKFIVFCKDIDHLNEMKKIIPKWFKGKDVVSLKVYTGHADSKYDFELFEKSEIKKDNKVILLFSIDMLNEGVHVKDIDGVILLRPTISPIIYYQQIGRAIQVGNSNNPLIFDFVNNFKDIGSGQFINDLKKSVQKSREQGISTVDINDFIIFDEIKEIKEIFEEIESRLVASWDYWFEKLCEFKKENGHTRVMRSGSSEEINSGLPKWVSAQRARRNLLPKEKIELLDSIGFVWSVDEDSWFNMFELCKEYIIEHGELTPSVKSVYKEERIGAWVARQKTARKAGELSKKRVELLDSIGFVWDIELHNWLKRLGELVDYEKKHGNYDMPRKGSYELLYSWTNKLKKQIKLNTLSSEMKSYVDKLLGEQFYYTLLPKKDRDWISTFNLYKENMVDNYVEKEKNVSLWRWACLQRRLNNEGKLSQEKTDMLNSIGFIWNEQGKSIGKGVRISKKV